MRVIGFFMLLISCLATAGQEPETPQETGQALVNISMSLELDGIERSINHTSESLLAVADSLNAVANNAGLTPEQQTKLESTVDSVNQLIAVTQQSLESLPQNIETSAQALNRTGQDFMRDLEFKILLFLCLSLLAVLGTLVGIYWFILRPVQQATVKVTTNLSSVTSAIKTSAQALENCSVHQKEIQLLLEEKQKQLQG